MTDPILLTPGPLTTAAETRQALLHDWGSWDGDFRALTARVRARLLDIVGAAGTHACVPIQGSGTYAVEAALGTLVPRGGKVLVLSNGAYGRRMVRTCAVIGRAHAVYETPEDAPPDPAAVAARLRADPAITHVGAIHCETGTGLLNPLAAIAAAVAGAGRALIVDAMSTFGSPPPRPGGGLRAPPISRARPGPAARPRTARQDIQYLSLMEQPDSPASRRQGGSDGRTVRVRPHLRAPVPTRLPRPQGLHTRPHDLRAGGRRPAPGDLGPGRRLLDRLGRPPAG